MLHTDPHIIFIVASFLLNLACGLLCTPYIIRFCVKKGLYDMPGARKVHKNAIPRLGGISFMPSMLLTSLIVMAVLSLQSGGTQLHVSSWSVAFFISLLLIYFTGITDDLAGLGAKTKFTAQVIAAAILPLWGLYLNNLYGLCGIGEVAFVPGTLLTIVVVVFICNAFNLIDGIDGLSSTLSFIALAGFLVCFYRLSMPLYCILIAGLMGVLLAFMRYNLLGKAGDHRKIFMGDSGSLSLGFILAFLAVKLAMISPDRASFRPNTLLMAYTFVLVPVFDVMRVSLVRIAHHASIFHADKNHIHHKLMRTGLSQHQALLAIILIALFYIGVNLLLGLLPVDLNIIVLIDISVWVAIHRLINRFIVRNGQDVYVANPETWGTAH